jgi:hypothetical protein
MIAVIATAAKDCRRPDGRDKFERVDRQMRARWSSLNQTLCRRAPEGTGTDEEDGVDKKRALRRIGRQGEIGIDHALPGDKSKAFSPFLFENYKPHMASSLSCCGCT